MAEQPLSAAGRAKQLDKMTLPQLKALGTPAALAEVPADLISTEAQVTLTLT